MLHVRTHCPHCNYAGFCVVWCWHKCRCCLQFWFSQIARLGATMITENRRHRGCCCRRRCRRRFAGCLFNFIQTEFLTISFDGRHTSHASGEIMCASSHINIILWCIWSACKCRHASHRTGLLSWRVVEHERMEKECDSFMSDCVINAWVLLIVLVSLRSFTNTFRF